LLPFSFQLCPIVVFSLIVNRPLAERGRPRLDSSKRKDRGVEGEEEENMLPPAKH
jgi:hypothetical protein